QEQMKLFREKGVNPIGGCLPMLAQMPVWFALYRMLWSSVDLYHQPFLWIRDLTHAEVFPIMAILVGGLTFVQQKTTPTQMDSQQMKMMMYVMPVMFSVFLIALPSGLVLYILVNSILTIVQQLAINRRTIPVAS
ncbi:MAG: membrane protein insertase YidC, partial [Clostridia bacterium]|nr:membrane protein insertase YidC [Deltaproteobacteria bacterium]